MDHAVVESEACCMCYNNYTNYNNVTYYTCQCHLPMVLECSLVNTFLHFHNYSSKSSRWTHVTHVTHDMSYMAHVTHDMSFVAHVTHGTCHTLSVLCLCVADQTTPSIPPRVSHVDQIPRDGHYTWRDHLHFYQQLHWCHPINVWHCCCHRGYDSFGFRNEWYSISGAGPLRAIALILCYCLIGLCCLPVVCFVACIFLCIDDSD